MHVEESGPVDAAPVLLLHGGGVAGWMWDDLRSRLEHTRRVLVPDLPGHGRSAGADYVSHNATVDDLARLLEDRAPQAAVIGFSLGAQLALLLAARRPEIVDRVLVVSAQARPLPFAGATLALLSATAGLARREWFARLQARELFVPDAQFADYFATSAAMSKATLLASVGENIRFRLPDEWGAFPGPVRVMVGGRERRLMRDSAEIVSAAVPHAGLQILDGAGHGIPLQRPEWFAAETQEWLAEI